MNNNKENKESDFQILDNIIKEIESKYEESRKFFIEEIRKKYFSLDFSTSIKDNEIEIYYIFNQNLGFNQHNIIKYSFIKKNDDNDWKFETKILNPDISDKNLEELDEIKKNIPSLQFLDLMKRTKDKKSNNIRIRVNRPEKFNLNLTEIKEKLYTKYFSLKNKNILIDSQNEVKYNISSVLTEFYFVKDLYLKNDKIGEVIIRNYNTLTFERELNFEIKYNDNTNIDKDNEYKLRNNYFLSNVFTNFRSIQVNDDDLLYNYYRKNLLIFNRKKLDLDEIRKSFYESVADSQVQAKNIISKEVNR